MLSIEAFLRELLKKYRILIYSIFGRYTKGVMSKGVLCKVESHDFTLTHGDVVHPCVRFSEMKVEGYHWWMVYTPYYSANAKIENPILCYSENDKDEIPVNWKFHSLIKDTPETGYNSDPNILIDENKIQLFWRETETPEILEEKYKNGTFNLLFDDLKKGKNPTLSLYDSQAYIDKQVSPTFLKHQDGYRAYAAHLRFKSKWFISKNNTLNKLLKLVSRFLLISELYSETKSYGIAIWESDSLKTKFKYLKTVKIQNLNKLYRPWHFDFFEYNNKIYCILQTNQSNADLCLAFSEDYESFHVFNRPLLTQANINMAGIYKATGFVKNDVFYLYYTAQDKNNRGRNSLFMSSTNFQELISILKNE